MDRAMAVIKNNTVVNVIIADDEYTDPQGRELLPADGLSIGMVRVDGEWTLDEGTE